MKKFVFLILSILVSGVASYFTVSQTEKFQEIQDVRTETNNKIVRISASNDQRLKDIAIQEANLEVALKDVSLVKSRITNLVDENRSIENQVAGFDAKLAAQEAQLSELKLVVAGVKQELSQAGIEASLSTFNSDFKGLSTSIEGKQAEDKTLDESLATEEKKLADKRAEIDRYNIRIQARDARIALNEIEARVTAVNQDWGFIVIGAGSNSGFMPDTKLLIKRDGRLIGTVKPSAIELTQTIADIDFNSLSPGVRFQVGDEVIVAKPASN